MILLGMDDVGPPHAFPLDIQPIPNVSVTVRTVSFLFERQIYAPLLPKDK